MTKDQYKEWALRLSKNAMDQSQAIDILACQCKELETMLRSVCRRIVDTIGSEYTVYHLCNIRDDINNYLLGLMPQANKSVPLIVESLRR